MKFLLKTFVTLILAALGLAMATQMLTHIWDFPEPSPFSGNRFHCPYSGIPSDRPFTETFAKGNFHAHTCFDTRHDYTAEELISAYSEQGYEIIGITDHQHINPKGDIPSYEHGYGLNNFHIGMYGAKKVDWLDNVIMAFPVHQMQSMFHRLRDKSDVTVFNHSSRLRLMDDRGIEKLREYDLFELDPSMDGGIWDRVLSTGFYVPLVASDDAHSIINRNSQFQRCYTMVYRGDPDPLTALLRGHSYAVCVSNSRNAEGHEGFPQLTLITANGTEFKVCADRPSDSIRFIGQGGRVLKSSSGLQSDSYTMADDDTYVRAEIFFDGIKMFTNPTARIPKVGFLTEMPSENMPLSILNWLLWSVLIIADIILTYKVWNGHSGGSDNYYRRGRRRHYDNTVIGIGLKPIDWN